MRWLRFQLLRRSRRERGRVRAWLAGHPRLEAFLTRTGSLHVDEYAIARGVAMGLLVGLTPTMGLQTVLMLLGAMLFRANFLAAYAVSFVSNPLTLAPLYFAFHELGDLVLSWLPVSLPEVVGLEEQIVHDAKAMLIGSLLLAIPAAVAGYFLAIWLWRKRQRRTEARRQRLSAARGDSGHGPSP
jgi:uncharacterized protein